MRREQFRPWYRKRSAKSESSLGSRREKSHQIRQHQKNVAIAQAINDAVAKEAARIEWQMRRMIELTRAKHQAVITAASSSAARAGVSPSPAPGAPTAAGQPKSMVEFMRETRSRQ